MVLFNTFWEKPFVIKFFSFSPFCLIIIILFRRSHSKIRILKATCILCELFAMFLLNTQHCIHHYYHILKFLWIFIKEYQERWTFSMILMLFDRYQWKIQNVIIVMGMMIMVSFESAWNTILDGTNVIENGVILKVLETRFLMAPNRC